MTEIVSIQEKVSRATRSSHLRHADRPCDIDKIGALGMASVSNALSSAVFRLKYANEARYYKSALAVVTAESKRLSRKYDWIGSVAQFTRLNKAVLDYWLNDRCMACEGRGYETILGTPVLSNDACGTCHGTGKLSPPSMDTKEWDGRFRELLVRIEIMERRAGADVMARLNREIRDLE